ncbi:MAG: FtsX-like permease family protein [Planctomycetota bacterium]|jgi:hypothetical protein
MSARRATPRPLAATTYLVRNPRRVTPVALVQALVTALMVAVITPTNIFETTSETYIQPLRAFTIVRPRIRNDFDEDLIRQLEANPALEKAVPAKMLWIETPMIVGDAVAPLLALDDAEKQELLRRLGLRLSEGHLPRRGRGEAAIHRAVLQARGMTIGDEFGQLADPEDPTPGRFRVVGILDGPARVGVIDLEYASIPDFVLARRNPFRVVYATEGRKTESDRFLRDVVDDDGQPVFFVVDEAYVRGRVERSMRNLPLLIGFISAAVAVIVALVTSLLNLIGFQTRTDEFALYLAVGHRRGRLVRKLAAEAFLISVTGWIAGLALGIAAVALYTHSVLEPKGILVRIWDVRPVFYSLSVPLLSSVVSAFALAFRLRHTDPVTVIQRRGA